MARPEPVTYSGRPEGGEIVPVERRKPSRLEAAVTDPELLERYNYDSFVPEKFRPWDRFSEGPALESTAPDFPLLTLDGASTRLSEVWSAHAYTVVEFGSFT